MFNKLLSLSGIFISGYLYFSQSNISYCPIGGCNIVAQSSYSSILGIPVSLIGVLGYLILFNYLMFFKGNKKYIYVGIVLTGTAFLFSSYLIYTSIFKINAICFWCTLSFIIITTLFINMNIKVKKISNIYEKGSNKSF